MTDSAQIIDILSQAAEEAAKLVKIHFEKRLEPQLKPNSQDLVTRADIESQRFIQDSLKRGMLALGISENEIGFIGEENGLDVKGKYLFAIDPIDGTTNFASGIEYFVISIGCFVDGELLYGVLYEPLTQVLTFAEKGKGAFKKREGREVNLHIENKDLQKSMVATYVHSDVVNRDKELSFIKSISPLVRGVRIMGAGALDLVKIADNVFQVFVTAKSNIWDIAAATLIIQEAGGVIVTLDGERISFDLNDPEKIYPVVACHPNNLEEVLTFLK